MNINYKPSQIELFPSNNADASVLSKPRFLFANLSLSVESLVILSILGIMVTVFAFAVGVEQGKKMVAQSLDERVAQAWNVDARRSHPVVAAATVAKAVNAMPVAVVNKPVAATVVTAKPMVKPIIKQQVVMPVKANALTAPVVSKGVVAASSAQRLTLQLATYRSENYARDEAMMLRGKGIQTFLVKSGDFWLVCSGQYKSKEEASGLIRKLPAKYRHAQVRRF